MRFSKAKITELMKKHNYIIPVLLISTLIALMFHAYFWNSDLEIQERYGKPYGIPGPDHNAALGELMDPSIFDYEGTGTPKFGGQDPTFILAGVSIIFYFLSFIPALEKRIGKYRIYFAAIFSYMAIGFVAELTLKWFFARPRPGDVFRTNNPLPFVHAFEIGMQSFEKAYHGSFPSGHTFAAAVLFIIPFLCLSIQDRKKKIPLITVLMILVLIWSALMGAGRVHEHAHFASDNSWAVYFAFIYCYFFYFYIFRVEEQRKAGPYQKEWKKQGLKWYEQPRKAWEFLLMLSIILFQIGVLVFALGIKELVNEIFILGFPMLTQLLLKRGTIVNPYFISFGMILLGLLLIFVFQWFIRINLKRRPSEIVKNFNKIL